MKYIRRVEKKDRDQINALRIREYSHSDDFILLKPEKLLWGDSDDRNVVLGAWNGSGRMVSTMRAVLAVDRETAMNCVACTVPDYVGFPAVVFDRAATDTGYRKLGLNQAIRYHLLACVIENGIKTILGPVYQGAPRTVFMKMLGYEFVIPGESWQDKLQPQKQRLLGILDSAKMASALDLLQNLKGKVIDAYPWRGSPIQFDITD